MRCSTGRTRSGPSRSSTSSARSTSPTATTAPPAARSSPSRASAPARRTRSSAWPPPTWTPRPSRCVTGSPHTVHARRRPAPGARAPPRRRQPADLRAGRQGVVAAVAGRRAAVRPPSGVERDALRAARARSCSTCRWTSRPTRPTWPSPTRPSARPAAARARRPTTSSAPRRSCARRARPVIVAGGGAISADAAAELTALAERLGAPVVTTWNGKGAIDEAHELAGADDRRHRARPAATRWPPRRTSCSSSATASRTGRPRSYRKGVTFAIPPTRLIQIDIDPREIGKNYPVEVAARRRRPGRARRPARRRSGPGGGAAATATTPYFEEIQRRKARVARAGRGQVRLARPPMTMARASARSSARPRDDAIVVTGAGLPQGMVKQRWVTRRPRTHLTSRRLLHDGLQLPAAIGAKLARPDRQVLAIAGDGDFLQTMQELATARCSTCPVCTVVLDNSGWISIKGGQDDVLRSPRLDRLPPPGRPSTRPDFAAIGAAFGLHSERVDDPDEVCAAVAPGARVAAGRRSSTSRSTATSPSPGPDKTGWWDAPVPEHHAEQPRAGSSRARPRSSTDEPTAAAAAAPQLRSVLRRPGDALSGASIGLVPILWNNVDLADLRPGRIAATRPRRDRAARLRGHPAGRGFPRGEALRALLAERDLRLAEVYAVDPLLGRRPAGRRPRARRASACAILHDGGGEVLVRRARLLAGARRVVRSRRGPRRPAPDRRRLVAPRRARRPARRGGARRWATASPCTSTPARSSRPPTRSTTRRRHGPGLVGLCLDVGHWTGRRRATRSRRSAAYGERVTHVHLKDVDPRSSTGSERPPCRASARRSANGSSRSSGPACSTCRRPAGPRRAATTTAG